MHLRTWFVIIFLGCVLAAAAVAGSDGKILYGTKARDDAPTDNVVRHHSLAQPRAEGIKLGVDRKDAWSLPAQALAPDFDTTINVLVLRFNFQEEEVDDPNTTGNGLMDLSNPLANPNDSMAYFDNVGHWIDPPPRDSNYFDAHMRALSKYWETVSEGRVTLTWQIWPPAKDSVYTLPKQMNEYGICYDALPAQAAFDTVVFGLEQYFLDCFAVADAVSPEIEFGDFNAYFLFHAGSDRQNDIGFPTTCSDMFTGWIRYRTDDTLWVDNDSTRIKSALIMPETVSQDNRGTALNAVIAHEFGHQLGLVDLYRTDNFITCLGDFALMDHNGFGTSIDFGFPVGGIFGTMPLYPSAWSRAYLGFVEVYDFRQGTDIELVAAEMQTDGIKIARVPISENEYYLLENRLENPDGRATAQRADSASGVILYPVDSATGEFTGEYDFLLPGSGVLIYHVDEGVAGLDYNGNGVNNFDENMLQLDPSRRFISLIEADGIVNMSGYYEIGVRRYGSSDDMFRDDKNRSFTPNTNPAAFDNSGNNTHVRITDIGRKLVDVGGIPRRADSVVTFDLETEKLMAGFPVRAGAPSFGLSPLVDDLNGDGEPEIIFASGANLCATTPTGGNFIHDVSQCDPCVTYYDSAFASVHPGRLHPVPLFARMQAEITAGPVTGDFGEAGTSKYVAVGRPVPNTSAGRVYVFEGVDADGNGQADLADPSQPFFSTSGLPIAMSFGERLWVLTDRGQVYLQEDVTGSAANLGRFENEEYQGICQLDQGLILMAGDSLVEGGAPTTRLYFILSAEDTVSFTFDGYYNLGPILVDVDRDGNSEVVVASVDGSIVLVSTNLNMTMPPLPTAAFQIMAQVETGYAFTVNPVAGDIDGDGYPDIVIGGDNAFYAFNRELGLLSDYPVEISDRVYYDDQGIVGYYYDLAVASPIVADIELGGGPEVVFPTYAGNLYSYGPDLSYGFPLSAGERGAGSPVVFTYDQGGALAYLGADGWFYAWEAAADSVKNYWPMGGHDPAGSFAFETSQLGEVQSFSSNFPEERFYNYPNPVTDGSTTIRYFLGADARRVELAVYDLSGKQVDLFDGPTSGGIDNELTYNCDNLTPGVYRCMIEVDFGGNTETAFIDIAVIR